GPMAPGSSRRGLVLRRGKRSRPHGTRSRSRAHLPRAEGALVAHRLRNARGRRGSAVSRPETATPDSRGAASRRARRAVLVCRFRGGLGAPEAFGVALSCRGARLGNGPHLAGLARAVRRRPGYFGGGGGF